MRPGRGPNDYPPFSAELRNEWSYTSILTAAIMSWRGTSVYLRNTAMYLGIITDRHNGANSRLSQLLERPCEWVTYFTRINCDMHKN
jgi:hypothetical protein